DTPRSVVMGLNPISIGNSLPSLRSPCKSRPAPIGLFAGDALYPARKATWPRRYVRGEAVRQVAPAIRLGSIQTVLSAGHLRFQSGHEIRQQGHHSGRPQSALPVAGPTFARRQVAP